MICTSDARSLAVKVGHDGHWRVRDEDTELPFVGWFSLRGGNGCSWRRMLLGHNDRTCRYCWMALFYLGNLSEFPDCGAACPDLKMPPSDRRVCGQQCTMTCL